MMDAERTAAQVRLVGFIVSAQSCVRWIGGGVVRGGQDELRARTRDASPSNYNYPERNSRAWRGETLPPDGMREREEFDDESGFVQPVRPASRRSSQGTGFARDPEDEFTADSEPVAVLPGKPEDYHLAGHGDGTGVFRVDRLGQLVHAADRLRPLRRARPARSARALDGPGRERAMLEMQNRINEEFYRRPAKSDFWGRRP
jgi:hypothetical protein